MVVLVGNERASYLGYFALLIFQIFSATASVTRVAITTGMFM